MFLDRTSDPTVVHLVPNQGKYAKALSYLVKIPLNLQHQAEHTFTMARDSAGVVRANIVNETAKRCAALAEIL